MATERTIEVKVFRFDPTIDSKPKYTIYEVPFSFEKMKVIDVLRYIYEKLDHSFSFTWDCRLWNCGLCGVTVNKRPCLACITDVNSVTKNNKLLIEPLPGYPVLKDLVLDRTIEIEQARKLGIKYIRAGTPGSIPEPMDPEKIRFHRDWYLTCIDCLVCNSACPVFSEKYNFIGPHLSLKLAKYLSHPKDGGNRAEQAQKGGLFQCLNCGRCDTVCPLELDVSSNTMELLKSEAVEKSLVPPSIRDFLENIQKFANPWGEPKSKRRQWTGNMNIEDYDSKKHKYLLYVGCVASYDTRAQQMSKALTALLAKADVSFGIMGNSENCDCNEVNKIGEKGLFQLIAEENIKQFNEAGVTQIITLSPHAYNTMKNDYPRLGGRFEVSHYTQILNDLMDHRRLKVAKNLETKITYHDPCFLGRHNDEYDSPRELLKAIPGVDLVEMERYRENSFCCGGGGGNFYTELVNDERSPGRIRAEEANNTDAKILAVSCPTCLIMLEDSVKIQDLDEKIVVKDISEILIDVVD